jgi:adenosylhomocysteine nucleosidase
MVAALKREIAPLIKDWTRIQREHDGRKFTFFEQDDIVAVCGGIGMQSARRAAEAVIALYHPAQLHSVGFAGALNKSLRVGDILSPAVVIDARDGSRHQFTSGTGTLLTFMAVADAKQKIKLAQAYSAAAVDMEAAAVAAAAQARGIVFGATKVISDELDFDMPGIARFVSAEGRFRMPSFVLFAALRPWLWRSVAVLALNSSKASHALCARLKDFCRDTSAAAILGAASSGAEIALRSKGVK